ncbi:24394_t:CDS:2 [Cetraspora pellucida]|uniref:24394_t:CDS:1 n=1 Tax=Cetraspora pellucida TaxID=1433469 RepID=A0A9N9D2N0_9GLOM|nr:24394_t:CDS:2 [Cetraspora pellucida]
MEEINILLLGESGIGKSTFINAFANYLKFPSLDEAKSGDLEILIPFRVKVGINDNITVGEKDQNESLIEGDSSTLGCRVYRFCIGDKVIRLIDTPGIGDTRGVKQDKINLENILAYINQFQYINGICMLFKSNQTRLKDEFKYCVKALVSQLHKSVKDNIIFCFTHTKGSNFKPGNTLELLKKLIKNDLKVELKTNDNTIYCFDNKSLSFIVQHKKDMTFDKFTEISVVFSWEKSVNESQRLLKYLMSLTPCNMRDSGSLYNARVMVSNLAILIVLIAQNIIEEFEKVKHIKKIFTEFLICNTLAAFDDVYLKCLQSIKDDKVTRQNNLEKHARTQNNIFSKYKNNCEKFDNESEKIQQDIDFLEKEINEHEEQVKNIKEYIQTSQEIFPDKIFILKDDYTTYQLTDRRLKQ